jgi:hypothetical protein
MSRSRGAIDYDLELQRTVTQLAELIDETRTGSRLLEEHLLGTTDSDEIAFKIEKFVEDELGTAFKAIFYTTSVGIVAGFRLLESGLDVVVKIMQWGVTEERLVEVRKVQEHLAQLGLPAPKPLVGPKRVDSGFGLIEEMKTGNHANGADPDVRKSIAFGFRRFVEAAQPLVGKAKVGTPLVLLDDLKTLWPEPHDLRFDFQATSEGAEWIDHYGEQARGILRDVTGDLAIGHFDWRVQNLAFCGSEIVAIYDWDSVGVAPEAVIVGCAAAAFSSTWVNPEIDSLPSVEEMKSFVEYYEAARGTSFNKDELKFLDAANLWLCAYLACCQHSNLVLGDTPTAGGTSWIGLLHERGSRVFV